MAADTLVPCISIHVISYIGIVFHEELFELHLPSKYQAMKM